MSQMTICLLIFAFMIVSFFIKKIPMSVTAILVMVLLVITGCTDVKTALPSFGSTTVITMVCMFIVAAGLSRTQMITHLSKLLYKVTKGSFTKVLATYVLMTCVLGQFIPSIVALFALDRNIRYIPSWTYHHFVSNFCSSKIFAGTAGNGYQHGAGSRTEASGATQPCA